MAQSIYENGHYNFYLFLIYKVFYCLILYLFLFQFLFELFVIYVDLLEHCVF